MKIGSQIKPGKPVYNRSTPLLRSAVESLERRMLLTTVVVNSVSDTATGAGVITLDAAIHLANISTTPTTIEFDSTVFASPKTITAPAGGFTTGLLFSNTAAPITLIGPAAGITIDGGQSSNGTNGGGLFIAAAVTASLSNLTITNFATTGLSSSGTLSLTDVTIANNTGSGTGGLAIQGGKATLVNVTIANNSGTGGGGAGAGGIANAGTLALFNSTISGNSRTVVIGGTNSGLGSAGGILSSSQGTVTIGNTIVFGNTGTNADADVSGAFASAGNNLIGIVTAHATGFVAADLSGSAVVPLNANLGLLAGNGGPCQTMLPLTGSPAIDAGSNTIIPAGVTTDARGLPRISNTTVDIGAVELQQNTLINGGFEQPGTFLMEVLAPNTTSIPGWSVTVGSVDVVNVYFFNVSSSYQGSQVLDLNGSNPGTIAQNFVTVPGVTYTVSFAYSNNYTGAASASAEVTVTDGSAKLLDNVVTHSTAMSGNLNWSVFSQTFTADGTSALFTLASLTPGPAGVMFDAVGVSATAPASTAATTTALASSAASASYGQAVTFTATVSSTAAAPTAGSVSFVDETTGLVLGNALSPTTTGTNQDTWTLTTSAKQLNATAGDTIVAIYNPGSGFACSSGVATQVITPVALTATLQAVNKVLDGTTADPGATLTLAGVLAGDTVAVGAGSIAFASTAAGNGIAVNANGISLSGASAANYTVNHAATATANITGGQTATAPTLVSAQIGKGNQHSSNITLKFNEAVNFSAGSFVLQRLQIARSGISWAGVTAGVTFANPSGDQMTWVITLLPAAANRCHFFAGGLYELTLNGSAITDAATGTAAFNNGKPQLVSFPIYAGRKSPYFFFDGAEGCTVCTVNSKGP